MVEVASRFGVSSRRDFLRYSAVTGAAVAVAGGLAACSGDSSSSSADKASGAKTLIFGQGTGPLNLDPLGPGLSTPLLGCWRQMYDTLVWSEGGKIVPQLAKSWKMVDPLTWEIALRDDVKFHNGEVFDATSVKFTMDRILNPAQKSTQAARFGAVASTEVVDAHTVRILTKTPFPVLLFGLTQAFIVPAKYTTDDPAKALSHPVGTGPFAFDSWKQGDNVKFVANKTYWGGAPALGGVTLRVIADDATRLAALRAGEIDIDLNVPLDSVDGLAGQKNIDVKSVFIQEALVIEFDTLHGGPTANPLVRQALNYAVDKDELIATLLSGKSRALDGQLMAPGSLGYNKNLQKYPYDPEKAKSLLAQAGYPNGFDLTLNGPIGKYPADRDVVVAVAAQLQKVGVRCKANPMEFSVFITKLSASQLGPAFLIGWYNFGDPALSAIWFTNQSTLGKYYNDPVYDKLVTEASGMVDTATRQTLYEQSSQHMYDQAMALYLFQPETFYGISSKVTGFVPRDDEIAYFYPASIT